MTEPSADPNDADPVAPDAPGVASVRPVDRFARSAAGSVLAAGLFGLRNALEGRPEQDRPVITAESPAAKPPEGFELILDPDHPERSIVILRPPESNADE